MLDVSLLRVLQPTRFSARREASAGKLAVNRVQGRSPVPPGAGKAAGTLASHAQDVAEIVATLRAPPVIVAHSFGGLILQRYLVDLGEQQQGELSLPGVAFLGSPGPEKTDLMRYLRNDPVMTFKVRASARRATAGGWRFSQFTATNPMAPGTTRTPA
jgi:pimeloyl-ACP methyl ester carboxylesterase